VTVPAIHAITTREILARPDFLATARRIMQTLGARGAVHLRVERAEAPGTPMSARRFVELADALVAEQGRTGATLVVNDRMDIALVAGAHAVQLPSHGFDLADAMAAARAAHRSLRCGVSVHTAEEARQASAAGAAWMIAGPVRATPTHGGARPLGLEGLRELCAASAAPVIAIGGIRPADVRAVRGAGAVGVAVVRGIWSGLAAEGACREYLSQL
jgi:thiamine-phosphate diphosphorylase